MFFMLHILLPLAGEVAQRKAVAHVLVSAGTELTLFLVAGTVLCLGFSVRMMLLTR